VAAILELDEQLNKDFTIFEAAPQVNFEREIFFCRFNKFLSANICGQKKLSASICGQFKIFFDFYLKNYF